MVRFTSLVFFATLLVSGLSSPLIEFQTLQADLGQISTGTTSVHTAVTQFNSNRTPANALAIHTRCQNLVATLNKCKNDMKGPAISDAQAVQAIATLNLIATDTFEALFILVSLKSAFQAFGAVGSACSDLRLLSTAKVEFSASLRVVFPSDVHSQLDAIDARINGIATTVITTYCG